MAMMVMDASAAALAAMGAPAGGVFRDALAGDVEVITTRLLEAEIRNVFWKYVHVGALATQEAHQRVEAAIDLVDVFVPIEDNVAESLSEAIRCDHSVYDMLYLTIARRTGAVLLTADKRLARLCNELGVRVMTP